jgi:hypothetical protein
VACKLAGGYPQCAVGFRLYKAAFDASERLPHAKVALCSIEEGLWLLADMESAIQVNLNLTYCSGLSGTCPNKVTTPKCNNNLSQTVIKVTIKASQGTQVRQNMFSIPTQGFKNNQWKLINTLRQPMEGGAFCT